MDPDLADQLFACFLRTIRDVQNSYGPDVPISGTVTRGWLRYLDFGAEVNLGPGACQHLATKEEIFFCDYCFQVLNTEKVWCLLEVDLPTPHGFN